MLKPIIICTFVALVILIECLFAWMTIPSQTDLETWAKSKAEAKAAKADDQKPSGKPEVEVDLGKYNVVVHQPASTLTLRVNFHLIGTVLEEENGAFTDLLAKNSHRLRDHVIFEIRNSQVEDLSDPGLALLKRKILAKSNDLLGKPILRSIVFSDFSFIEQ
ncbi:MAG: hypothetical protein SFU86_18300 [Pirellulaceae bacterium]|nr:hypothetical protein [Pirellulaceae bacterium]